MGLDLRHAAAFGECGEWYRRPPAVRFYRDFAGAAPDEASVDAVCLTTPEGQRLVALSACYVGPP